TTATQSLDTCRKARDDAKNLYTSVDKANKNIEGVYKIYQNESQKKTLDDERAGSLYEAIENDVDRMNLAYHDLINLFNDADVASKAVKNGSGQLYKDHIDELVKIQNECKVLFNGVGQFRDRTQLLLSTAEGFAKEIKKAAGNQLVSEKAY